MEKNNWGRQRMEAAIRNGFLILEIFIYIAFMYMDLSEKGSFLISNYLKFMGIMICFVISLLLYSKNTNKIDITCLRGALLFTVFSDLFILILDYYMIGLVTFCIVQLLYLIRLSHWRKQMGVGGEIWKNLMRNGLITMAVLGIFIKSQIELEAIVIISSLYFISIVFNVIDAVLIAIHSKKSKQILFAVGMVSFLLCDINVGLFNLSDFVTIDGGLFSKLYSFATIAMWMFYLPAQVIIVLSGDSNVFDFMQKHAARSNYEKN